MNEQVVEAYPLSWPIGKERTKSPVKSSFKVSQNDAQFALMNELNLLGAKNIIISTNIKLRNDGLPYASQKQPKDKGVAVYFMYEGDQVSFACDRWDKVADNIQAIRHTINALRGISRWGTGDMVKAAFRGFVALPAPMTELEMPWHVVLKVNYDSDFESIKKSYRALAAQNYNDNDELTKLNTAYNQAKKIHSR